MRLARGEIHKRDAFEVHKGRSSDEDSTNQFGPGVYFFTWKERKKATPYAIENPAWYFDSDEPEEVDRGYFYGCKLSQNTPKLLDEIPAEEMTSEIPVLIDSILQATKCNEDYLDRFDDGIDDPYDSFVDFLLEYDDSAYGVIRGLWDVLDPECNQAFCSALEPTLEKIGSFAANADRDWGEVIVYAPSKIAIDRVIEVTRNPEFSYDRDNPGKTSMFLFDGSPSHS